MLRFNEFIEDLKFKLSKALPGPEAQLRMEPATRKVALERMKHQTPPRNSGVLILFYPKQDAIYTVFIKRQVYQGVHSGQIAFPGGQYEKMDASLIDTALREAKEEIGLKIEDVKVLGELTTLFIPPSNFNVLPVVACTKSKPDFILDPKEVQSILEIQIDHLINPESVQSKSIRTRNQQNFSVPCYYLDNEVIWGATAMIISELIEVITK